MTNICLKIVHQKLHLNLPGANELNTAPHHTGPTGLMTFIFQFHTFTEIAQVIEILPPVR